MQHLSSSFDNGGPGGPPEIGDFRSVEGEEWSSCYIGGEGKGELLKDANSGGPSGGLQDRKRNPEKTTRGGAEKKTPSKRR